MRDGRNFREQVDAGEPGCFAAGSDRRARDHKQHDLAVSIEAWCYAHDARQHPEADMGDALELTTRQILEPGGIDRHELSRVLDTVLGHAVDDADLYFQAVRSEAWVLEDGIVKEGSHNIEQGVGVRAVSGEKSGFAYADEVALPALQRAAGAARAIAKAGASGRVRAEAPLTAHERYPPLDPLLSFGESERIDLLRAVDAEARAQDPRVKQVRSSPQWPRRSMWRWRPSVATPRSSTC